MFRLLAISYTNIQLWNSTIGFKNLNRSCFFWTELRQMINWKIIAVLCKVNVDANQLEIFKVQIHQIQGSQRLKPQLESCEQVFFIWLLQKTVPELVFHFVKLQILTPIQPTVCYNWNLKIHINQYENYLHQSGWSLFAIQYFLLPRVFLLSWGMSNVARFTKTRILHFLLVL